jgi:hypothetical protein
VLQARGYILERHGNTPPYFTHSLKIIPHNTTVRLAVPFPPAESCKCLDLPPENLQDLPAHLTDLPRSFQPKITRQSTTLIYAVFS